MAKKNGNPDTSTPEKAPVQVDASRFTKNAQPVLSVTDKWNGVGPSDLQPGLKSTDLEQFKLADLENREITILGYQERTGTLKGKETEYVLLLIVVEGSNNASICLTGASVVVKKVRKSLEAGALPIKGRVVECQGADFNYYDLVS
jgi:hypothetical protein